jgi:hypothetical protein
VERLDVPAGKLTVRVERELIRGTL